MKTNSSNPKKLSVLSVLGVAGKVLVGIFSWLVTILFMIVVLIITNKKSHTTTV